MPKKVLSVKRTVYPLDYHNTGDGSFNTWSAYIHAELHKSVGPCEVVLMAAKKIINQKTIRK